jgi:hypothetical protein
MPGGNNGVYPDRYAFDEYERRNAANLQWLQRAYQEVQDIGAQGLVVLFHGNPGWDDIYWRATAYRDFKSMLAYEGAELGVPILAVHGDTHEFTIDKPLMFTDGRSRADHLTRLEVFCCQLLVIEPADQSLSKAGNGGIAGIKTGLGFRDIDGNQYCFPVGRANDGGDGAGAKSSGTGLVANLPILWQCTAQQGIAHLIMLHPGFQLSTRLALQYLPQ